MLYDIKDNIEVMKWSYNTIICKRKRHVTVYMVTVHGLADMLICFNGGGSQGKELMGQTLFSIIIKMASTPISVKHFPEIFLAFTTNKADVLIDQN